MKIRLTKDQRFTAYCIMLAEAEEPDMVLHEGRMRSTIENGLCWLYYMIFGTQDMYHISQELLPEIHMKIIEGEDSWDWGDWSPRKEALKQCIEETAPNKK